MQDQGNLLWTLWWTNVAIYSNSNLHAIFLLFPAFYFELKKIHWKPTEKGLLTLGDLTIFHLKYGDLLILSFCQMCLDFILIKCCIYCSFKWMCHRKFLECMWTILTYFNYAATLLLFTVIASIITSQAKGALFRKNHLCTSEIT